MSKIIEIKAKRGKLYDLDEPGNKQIILDFEKFIKDLELNAGGSEKSLIFYGRPHFEWRNERIAGKGFNSFVPNERIGYVFNSILGLVHWSLVDWCVKNHIIIKNGVDNWAIVGHMKGRNMITPEYDDFNAKIIRITELREKRNFAKQQQLKDYDLVISSMPK